MDQLLSYLLTLILLHGYPIIFAAIFFAYLGMPIPLNALLLAAGAFTADGTLSITVVLPLVILTAIIGDVAGYFLGKKFGLLLINSYTAKVGLTESKLNTVSSFLENWGGMCVFFTRWLITPLGIPVNIISGVNKYPFKYFLLWTVTGEFLWACIYVFIGRAFGANWVTLLEYINDVPSIFASLVIGAGCLFVGFKMWKNQFTSHYS